MQLFRIAILLTGASAAAFATTASCPTASLATTGCSQVDMNFSNITLGPEGNNWTVAPVPADIDFGGSQGTISGNPSAITTVNATITSPNATSTPSGGGWYVEGKKNAAGSVSFDATTNNGTAGSAPVNPNGAFWVLSSLILTINSFATDSGGTMTVTEEFCLNGSAISGCAAAAAGTITATIGANSALSYSWVLGAHSGMGDTVNLAANFIGTVSSVFIDNTIAMSDNSGNAYLNNFTDGFDQQEMTPEPSSFVLAASALAIVIAIRRFSKSTFRKDMSPC
jgi:hypothetical protein